MKTGLCWSFPITGERACGGSCFLGGQTEKFPLEQSPWLQALQGSLSLANRGRAGASTFGRTPSWREICFIRMMSLKPAIQREIFYDSESASWDEMIGVVHTSIHTLRPAKR
jgi:hypothetical protein